MAELRARRGPSAGRGIPLLAWRQYRLERRMFWRNPSAAFFNFLLPLLFLAGGGILLSGNHHELNRLVPALAAMRVMSSTVADPAYNLRLLPEAGVRTRTRGPRPPPIRYAA